MMKKGQLTIFIIIGLILLMSISLVIYLTTREVVKPVEEEVIVPEDVRPVYEFVQSCANDIAREGLGLLGLQGGFINLPGIIDRTPSAYIPIDSANYFKVPLWYYEGEDRTPSLGYMEREIARYVNERIKECTGEFEPFQERFAVREEGNVTTRTIITDDQVILRISWPLALATPERTTRVQDYVVRMPVRLKHMWEIANATMAAENQHAFFENVTIDLMAADSDNIPMDGFTIECGVKRWRLQDIEQRLQQLLYWNIATARIKNTDYWPFTAPKSTYEGLHKEFVRMTRELERSSDYEQGKKQLESKVAAPDDAYQYFKLFYDVGVQRPTDIKVSFEYQPDWGMELNAQPSEGPVLKSNTGKGAGKFLRFLCINQWHFAYDIIYPIKVTIRDDQAFAGEGFVFQFAFPVLVNDNAPERLDFGLRRFQSIDFGSPEFCTTYGDKLTDIRALGEVEGVPVLMELPDAEVTYRCFDQECELGTTGAGEGIYQLLTYLPRGCANPFITARKEGYLPATAQLSGDRLDLRLPKLQDMKLKFVVHPYHGPTKAWGTPKPLKDNEQVSLHISLVNKTFDQFISFPTTNETLQLVQETAHYDIDAMLFLRRGKEASTFTEIGGYSAAKLKIPYDAIAGKTTAVIHVVEYLPSPITDEQKLNMITYLMEGDYRDALQPTFE